MARSRTVSSWSSGDGLRAVRPPWYLHNRTRRFDGIKLIPIPGPTNRLGYTNAPRHVDELEWYHARGYPVAGNRIAITTDRPEDLVEVHPPSRGTVDVGGLTVERCPPGPAME